MTDYQEERIVEHDPGQDQRVATIKATQIIWLLLVLLEAALGLRVLFKLLAVNPSNPFASFLYNFTNLFVAPFANLTGAPAVGGSVLEVSTLIAMLIYLLFAWALARIVYVLFYRPSGTVNVRQTTIAEHDPRPMPWDERQTTTTERTTIQSPGGTRQTTVTERTNNPPPDSP